MQSRPGSHEPRGGKLPRPVQAERAPGTLLGPGWRSMSGLAEGVATPPDTLESIKACLAGLVREATKADSGRSVRLTHVGGEFAKETGVAFEKRLAMMAESGQAAVPVQKRKLAAFVEAYCSDMLDLTRDPSGVCFVSLVAPSDAVAAPQRSLRFHSAVWAAFIRPIEGSRRFMNLDKIGFTNAPEQPSLGRWLEIEPRFVLGAAAGAAVDGAALQRNIEEWARAGGVDMSRLVVEPPPRRKQASLLEALLDIVDDLPDAAAAEWAIPASVLRHLRYAR